ncbi:substrate-binding domain-containing protein [Coraliomargarita akajimensis]|uniref:Transcriptional regulator, AraC family n=1 Tax=Coraliomargarita akajimensis (strain DSM 45221 / IAM 15411 / JCM 23193 / KCTC 12865 / 04OKA010-24) TaxID=583355 RepID=D5EJ42_CORAD|nr:substrate-binding domain-containing protein [Coraliomargarita akajimensis]ADE54441.1 transcriptional regulator, AraC family [Coraliomargarita akajimensis DSM 45221]
MSQQIAIVMTEVFLRRITPALVPFVRQQQDYRIVSIHRPIDELKRLLTELQPSGLITEWLPDITEALLDLNFPTVIADTDFSYPGVVSIDVDDWAVGAEAAQAFVQAGYRSVACLGNGTPYSDQRIEGFCREIGHSVPVHTEQGFTETRYSEHFNAPTPELRTWLEGLPKPVGIFAVHDPLGRFLCGTCQQLGWKVPEQVAVIGANNDDLVCGLSYPMLSSVAIPWEKIGELVGESMHSLLAGEVTSPEPVLLPPGGVVLRHSANHLAVEDPTLRRAMSYLSERLQDPISVGGMCADLRVARRGLERKFQEFYRCTPWEMLCQMRVNQAKHLLAETNHPVSMISDLCGFNDPERMAVVFKRLTGEPPSQFRKRL